MYRKAIVIAKKILPRSIFLKIKHTYARVIEHEKYAWKKMPSQGIMIELTNACNFSCTMCANKLMQREKGFMDIGLFELVLDRVQKAKISRITLFTTGESLLHPKFLDMLQRAVRRRSIKEIAISTNGSLLEKYMGEILKTNKTRVYYSFSGWDKKSYEGRYLGGVFEKTVATMTFFNKMIHEAGLPSETLIAYGIIDNDEAKEKTINFLTNTIGLNTCQISVRFPFNWVVSVLGDHGGGGNESTYEEKKARAFCWIINSQLGVLYDGRVTACACVDVNGDLVIGDISKQSIKEIMRGSKRKKFLHRFIQGDLKGLLCYECNNKIYYRA